MRTVIVILFLAIAISLQAQPQFNITELAPMPIPIANNAVVAAEVQGVEYVYSFGGIRTGLTYAQLTLNAYRYHVATDTWDTLPPLPDTLGKIASGASYVNGKIYIIGGYHVFPNGNEISSNRVHIFDPATNTYLPDGAPIPVPIDDQVQTVWRDSLIYVVAGWSDVAHVTNVQIYNPTTNTWSIGSPIPNTQDYKAFGASGVMIDDTIFYMGGARTGLNFPVTPELRKGIVNPNDPTQITWSYSIKYNTAGYRMGAAIAGDWAVWVGGAGNTYNFNAAAYDGSGLVNPENRIILYNPALDSLLIYTDSLPTAFMDLRGTGQLDSKRFITCGGLLENAVVSNRTFLFEDITPTSINEPTNYLDILLYPNPTQGKVSIEAPMDAQVAVTDMMGKVIMPTFHLQPSVATSIELPSSLPQGMYWICVETATNKKVVKLLLLR